MIIALLFGLLSACGEETASPPTPTENRSQGGPLSALTGSGGVSVDAPGRKPYRSTFGGFVLCLEAPAGDVTLESVRTFGDAVDPDIYVRTVDPAELAGKGRRGIAQYVPMINGLGSPPAFSEPYSNGGPAGDYVSGVAGLVVDEACADTELAIERLSTGPPPESAISELMISFTVPVDGATVTRFSIDYTADGIEYSLPVRWRLVGCGSRGGPPVCP